MMVDSHCHLDGKVFDTDRDEVIQRAIDSGIERMLAIGTGDGPPDLEPAIRLADRYPVFLATVGVHPHEAAKYDDQSSPRLRELLRHPKVVALGEIGLDYHYDFSPRDVQKRVFIEQIAVAKEAQVPIVIHTREAWDDTFALLEEHWKPSGLGGIMHCFTGSTKEMERTVELGFHLGFGGVVTYPKAVEVHESARVAPLDRLLLETDAPYLAPVPKRGKRNEPSYVLGTARRIAELRSTTLEEIARATTANFERLFPRHGLQ
jgi:TatD DNase family protein